MRDAGLGVHGPCEAFVGGGGEEDRGVEGAEAVEEAGFGDRCDEVSGWDVAVWWEGDGVYVVNVEACVCNNDVESIGCCRGDAYGIESGKEAVEESRGWFWGEGIDEPEVGGSCCCQRNRAAGADG